MDSVKALKGYDKVIDHENQIPIRNRQSTSRKALITTIAVSSILVVIAIIGFIVSGANLDPDPAPESAESLETICSVTRYPDSCLTSLSSASNGSARPDPASIFQLSVKISMEDIAKLSNSFRSINDLPEDAAVRDCLSQLGDALSRLNDSVSAMDVGPGEKVLTEEKIGDVRTWISAAMTGLETCSDELEEMGTVVGGQIETQMRKAKELLSNSLAMVSKMKELLVKFHSSLH